MSIAAVARKAGVSQATVSRVINRRPGVSPDIAQAVKQAIRLLKYEPPPIERRPGRRVTPSRPRCKGIIAVVVLDELHAYTGGIIAAHLRGIEAEAATHSMTIAVVSATGRATLASALSGIAVEGLILIGANATDAVWRALKRYPHVWLGSHQGEDAATSVLAGNREIGQLAAQYLTRRGHDHLAFLAVHSKYPAYPVRLEAFLAAAEQAGATVALAIDDEPTGGTLADPDDMRAQIVRQVDRLLSFNPRPTGVFVPNDFMTAVCYDAFRRRGVEPGRDVEFVSCNNDLPYQLLMDPRPATIDIGAEQTGRNCVDQLIREIRRPGDGARVRVSISPVLIEPGPTTWPAVRPECVEGIQ